MRERKLHTGWMGWLPMGQLVECSAGSFLQVANLGPELHQEQVGKLDNAATLGIVELGWQKWLLVFDHYSMWVSLHAAASAGGCVNSGNSTKRLRCCWRERVDQTRCCQVLGTGPTCHAMHTYSAMQLAKSAAALSIPTLILLKPWCFWTTW